MSSEGKTAEERKVAWDRIREVLPRKKTPEDKKRRIALFKKFDADGSKSLTLDETYQGLIDHCQLDEFTTRLKDICKRAFNKAKSLGTEDRDAGSADEVEFLEFRLMLCYIYDYFELTVMFDEIDTDGSMMIDEQEFKEAVPRIAEWGVQINDPEATFRQIDANGSGQMTFDEFCSWASAAKLDADGDPDNTAGPGEVPPPAEEAPVAAARGLPDAHGEDGEVVTRVFKKMPREVRERRSRIREERLSGIRGSRIGNRSAQAPPLAATAPEAAHEAAEVPAMAEEEPVVDAPVDAPVDAVKDDAVPEDYPVEEPAEAKADSPDDYPVEEPAAAGAAAADMRDNSDAPSADPPEEAPATGKKEDKKEDKDDKKDDKKEKEKGGCCMVM